MHSQSQRPVPVMFRAGLILLVTLVTLAGMVPRRRRPERRRSSTSRPRSPTRSTRTRARSGQSQAITRFMFRGLTRFAIKDGKVTTAEVEPDLAESWTLSPDGTIWTFKLKKGVQFHKGFGEMTAEDVKFSFERQINKTPGTRYGVNLDVDQVDRGRRPLHRADRAEGLRRDLPAAHGGLPAGLHRLQEGGRRTTRSSSGTPSAPAPSTSSATRRARRSSSRPSTSSSAAGRRSTRSTGSTCRRTPPS